MQKDFIPKLSWLGHGLVLLTGFSGGSVIKILPANAGDWGSILGSGKILWKRKWQLIPIFLSGEFHGQRSLASYSSWGHKRVRHY